MDITESILAELKQKNRRDFLDKRQESQEFATNVIKDIEYFVQDIWAEGYHLDFHWASLELQKNQMGYVYCGLLLEQIFRYKLWHRDRLFNSPKEFCEKLMGRTLAYAKRLIKAAKVCIELIRAGFDRLPLCESQCRPLTKLYLEGGDNCELVEKWQEILDNCPGPITAEAVAAVLGESEKPKQIKVEKTTFDKLLERANSRGFTTVTQFLEAIAEGRELPEEPEPEETPTPPEEIPAPPEELKITWLEKQRDRFLSNFHASSQIKQAKAILNEYIYSLWLELLNSSGGSLCNSS